MRIAGLLLPSLIAFGQNFSDARAEKVLSNKKFTEGPAWAKEGFLLFSDVPANQIFRIGPEGTTVYRDNSNGANGNAYDDEGRLYTCESRTRRVVRQDRKGKIEVLAERYQGKRLNAPNDIVVSKSGHIYFTDPAFGPSQTDGRELDFYGVYQITTKGELVLIAKPQGRPNGIALSPDQKTLYVANSDERNVRAYDIARDGAASNERVLVSSIEGVPDGMKTDEKGNLYVTAKHVSVYTPDGKPLGIISIPETPANCAFGDPDLKSLYVTARTSVYRVRVDVKGAMPY
jgi:gluconolactonase